MAVLKRKWQTTWKGFLGEVIEPPSPRTERESVLVRYPAWRLPLWRNWFKDATALINDAANTNTHTLVHTHKIEKKIQPLLGKDVGKQQVAIPENTRRTKFGTQPMIFYLFIYFYSVFIFLSKVQQIQLCFHELPVKVPHRKRVHFCDKLAFSH